MAIHPLQCANRQTDELTETRTGTQGNSSVPNAETSGSASELHGRQGPCLSRSGSQSPRVGQRQGLDDGVRKKPARGDEPMKGSKLLTNHISDAEWAMELAETLQNGGHGLAQITVGSYESTTGRDQIIAPAKNAAELAGWPLLELSARDVTADPSILLEAGFTILREVDSPLPVAVPVLIGAFQHLVQRDLPVALLVVGTVQGVRAMRRHPGLGFLSRAESVIRF